MGKMKEVKIKVSEQEFQVLSDVLLNLEIPVAKGFIVGGFLQKLYVAFRKEEEKEVEKDGKD